MKELSIEQKAKRYDEVVNEIKKLRDILLKEGVINENGIICDNFNRIFPELNETDDEKIKKEIIALIEWSKSYATSGITTDEANEMFAWLERQNKNVQGKSAFEAIKEEKVDIANKVEVTKFKVGDWVVSPMGVYWHIDKISNNRYEVTSNTGASTDWSLNTKLYHRFTIQDAKEGDVLSYVTDEEDLWIMIYWSLYEPYEGHVHYHALLVNDNFADKGTCCICIDDLKPATKEQRDLLFAKMKKAGYEWDSEQKQLITLNHFVDNNDMVEPKFKDGDWIVYKDSIWKVCNIALQNYYELLKTNNEVATRLIKDVDENAHLWTINDAKPGDIIYAESKFNTFDFIAIFSEIKNKNSWEYCSVDSDSDDYSDDLDHWEFDDHKGFVALDRYNFYPATKKQRHLLYQKMKDAGYEWDAEKKELKDI